MSKLVWAGVRLRSRAQAGPLPIFHLQHLISSRNANKALSSILNPEAGLWHPLFDSKASSAVPTVLATSFSTTTTASFHLSPYPTFIFPQFLHDA